MRYSPVELKGTPLNPLEGGEEELTPPGKELPPIANFKESEDRQLPH